MRMTISDKGYQRLQQKAIQLAVSPEDILEAILMSPSFAEMYIPSFIQNGDNTKSATTLGDLLSLGYGYWSYRNDIDDSVAYAQELRQSSWQRHSA